MAPQWLTINGPITGESFRTCVEHVLVPELRPGDSVVMDNLGSHKAPAIRRAIRAAGAGLFCLSAWSPDPNPTLQAIARLKHLPRKAAERTKEAVWRRIAPLLEQFPPQDCETCIRNAGSGSVQGPRSGERRQIVQPAIRHRSSPGGHSAD